MTADVIAAPNDRLREGLRKVHGYALDESGDRVSVAFEPDLVEAPDHHVPCIRAVCRRRDGQVVLETFSVCDGDPETPLDLDAAHNALQTWVDRMTD
ncbi:MAG: hypothetical protein A3K66_02195 [Euryarchaeota archaeon RBG_16_67_27]|nr:MAG: hypothetical protein A3K66_02195 [Euryarchaeota archaeon RBG_16_67_27]